MDNCAFLVDGAFLSSLWNPKAFIIRLICSIEGGIRSSFTWPASEAALRFPNFPSYYHLLTRKPSLYFCPWLLSRACVLQAFDGPGIRASIVTAIPSLLDILYSLRAWPVSGEVGRVMWRGVQYWEMVLFAWENKFRTRKTKKPWSWFQITVLLFVFLGSAGFFLHENYIGGARHEDIYNTFLRLHPKRESLNLIAVNPAYERDQKCQGKFIYIYSLPPDFNEKLIDRCGRTSKNWFDMCGKLENSGLGPLVPQVFNDSVKLEPANAWYRTEQFSLEVLFHERMKEYSCLTSDPDVANAFYIPYYAALDTAFTLFSPYLHIRDRLTQRLIGWLSGSPVWSEYRQRRHFMVLGRISWDFSRPDESEQGWGSALLSQPEFANVTKLLIERKTWIRDEIAVPYPTSFHPSSDEDLKLWQEKLQSGPKRQWLCSFVGASRGPKPSRVLRAELERQCDRAKSGECKQVRCGFGDGKLECAGRPEVIIKLFRSSIFCLQPAGDSPTRKGLFDSMVAGCIPVLFSNSSAYLQYSWHLLGNGSEYSVYFDGDEVAAGKRDVIQELAAIAGDGVRLERLQAAVRQVLPRIIYALPGSRVNFSDAFDIALENFLGDSPIPAY